MLLGNIHYGVKVDVWSLGCIFAEMLLGTPMFPGEDDEDQMLRIIGFLGSPNLDEIKAMAPHHLHPENLLPPKLITPVPLDKLFADIPSMVVDFFSTMLTFDPANRWPVSRLLRHPLLASED